MKQINATKTSYLTLCGLFAALTAICSWVSVPLGFTPVPVNLATLAVFLAGGLLGPKYGALSIAVYALAGAVGVPVFAGFKGGLGVIAGPTGGFIAGYIAAAFVVGLLVNRLNRNSPSISLCTLALAAGTLACYVFGLAWFMISTNTGVISALVLCVVPFIPGDILKIAAGTVLIKKLRRFI